VGPVLAEDLVAEAAGSVLPVARVAGRHALLVVLTVEEVLGRPVAAAFEERTIALRRRRVADVAGHLFAGAEGREIEGAHERVRADEVDVVRIVLSVALEQAVIVAVLADQVFERRLDARPVLAQEHVVRGREMLAVALQDGAGLAVGGEVAVAAETHEPAGLLEPRAEVLHRPCRAGQLGEQPGLALRVVPDVRARAAAAVGALPRPEAPVLPPLRRARREVGHWHHQPRRQPPGQRCAAIVAIAEAPRFGLQARQVSRELPRDIARVAEPVRVHPAVPGVQVWEIPRHDEGHILRGTRGQRELACHRADQRLPAARLQLAAADRTNLSAEQRCEKRILVGPVQRRLAVAEQRQRQVAEAQGGLIVLPVLRPERVGQYDVIDVDVAPSARGRIHDLDPRHLPREHAHVPHTRLQFLVVAPGRAAHHAVTHHEVQTRRVRVPAAADAEGQVRQVDLERRADEPARRRVAAMERVDQSRAAEAAHFLLVRQRAPGGFLPKRLAGDGPPVVRAHFEVGDDLRLGRAGRHGRTSLDHVHQHRCQPVADDGLVAAFDRQVVGPLAAGHVLQPAAERDREGLCGGVGDSEMQHRGRKRRRPRVERDERAEYLQVHADGRDGPGRAGCAVTHAGPWILADELDRVVARVVERGTRHLAVRVAHRQREPLRDRLPWPIRVVARVPDAAEVRPPVDLPARERAVAADEKLPGAQSAAGHADGRARGAGVDALRAAGAQRSQLLRGASLVSRNEMGRGLRGRLIRGAGRRQAGREQGQQHRHGHRPGGCNGRACWA